MTALVYFFKEGKAEGAKLNKSILGGKGRNLMEMANLGVPVPPGFVITTEGVQELYADENIPA